jgi:hypothetical protein
MSGFTSKNQTEKLEITPELAIKSPRGVIGDIFDAK